MAFSVWQRVRNKLRHLRLNQILFLSQTNALDVFHSQTCFGYPHLCMGFWGFRHV